MKNNKIIEVKLPRGFDDISVTPNNRLVVRSSDDSLSFPLPEGKWVLTSVVGEMAYLFNNETKV